jgi:hypothetical protein
LVGNACLGEVAIVDLIIDAASGAFGVRLTLANDAGTLPAGLPCGVRSLAEQEIIDLGGPG